MSAETLTMFAGVLLSLGFSYIPGLSTWYARLGKAACGGASPDGGTLKRLVMLAMLALAAGGVFGLACSSWGSYLGLEVSCDQSGAAGLVRALVFAVIANQATYKISPRGGEK